MFNIYLHSHSLNFRYKKMECAISLRVILEQQIDLIVYHLYNLTYDEVLIIDPEIPISRDEYEKVLTKQYQCV